MNNLTSQLDPKIQQLLQSLRTRIKMYVWVEGISLGMIWVTSMFWIGLAMDYLPILVGANELSSVARAILLGIVAAALGYILYRWVSNERSLPSPIAAWQYYSNVSSPLSMTVLSLP